MKKIFKNPIFTFILGAIIFGGIVGVSAYTIFANDIGYTPKDSTWKKSNGEDITNVKDAIDELYSKSKDFTNGLGQTKINMVRVGYRNEAGIETPLELNEGKYLCNAEYSMSYNGKNIDSKRSLTLTINNCDEYNITAADGYSKSANSISDNNDSYTTAMVNTVFTCVLNEEKTISVKYTGYSGSIQNTVPVIQGVSCTSIE